MKSKQSININQAHSGEHDPDTGEIREQVEIGADDVGTIEALFGGDAGSDGSIIIPKITAATLRSNPERAKIADEPMKMFLVTGMAGNEHLMPGIGDESRLENLPMDHIERMTFTALVAAIEPWGAVRFDDEGEPEAVFKSDFLFLPVGHIATLARMRQYGQIPIAFEFWAQPSSNVRGYSWYVHNLAKYDRNISPIDRLLKLGVEAGRRLALDKKNVGLLADLRSH